MNPYNFILLFYAFCSFFLGFLVWLKRFDKAGVLFLIFNGLNASWATFFALSISENISYEKGLFLARCLNSSALFIPPTWYYFCLEFTKEKKSKTNIILSYSIAFFILMFAPTPYFVKGVRPVAVFNHCAEPGVIFYAFTTFFLILITMSFVVLIKRLRKVQGEEKFVIKGLLVASGIAFTGGSLTFLWVYGISLPPYNLLIMPVYPFLMAYFIMRRNLFGLEEFAEIAHKEKLATISTLASSVNHEIKNPLYIIKSHAESFLEKESAFKDKDEALEKSREILNKAVIQTNRAMDIMRRFSSFAKSSDTKGGSAKVKVRETVEDVLQLISYELESIQIENQVPEHLAINFSARDLEQILFNLIRNAGQAVGQSGKVIISSELANNTARIYVKDNGPGISNEQKNQIFKPFYSTKEEGSGVGLYVTKQLVEQNGGKISVASEQSTGTTFTLEFKNESV